MTFFSVTACKSVTLAGPLRRGPPSIWNHQFLTLKVSYSNLLTSLATEHYFVLLAAEISSKPKRRDPIPNSNASMGTEIDVGMESSLVSICFWVGGLCNLSGHGDSTSYHGDNEHPIKDVLQQSDVVVIATHHGIILLRMSTLELIAFKDLKG